MAFKDDGYEIVRNVISEQLLLHLKTEFEIFRNNTYLEYGKDLRKDKTFFSDDQSKNSFSVYSARFFESLALILNPKISDVVGLELYPTYTYARIYYNGSNLNPHIDRPSCEYSTTVCIDSTDIWDFYLLGRDGKEKIVKLNPGDMCVYSGCELIHWRKPYQGNRQMQCFLHYVNSNGPYKDFKFDKRKFMGEGEKVNFFVEEKINYIKYS